MRKSVIFTISLLVIIAMLSFAVSFYNIGRREGIRHAIEDSIIWTVERYDPDYPEANAREDGTDQTIYIELDTDLYAHGMYQG